ncbi:MAG: NAD(P)-dependent oxidoreductase [Chloroflexota bacterium]
MRIAVTGAAGAIGRVVVAELRSRGHEVVAIDRSAPGAADPGTGGQVGIASPLRAYLAEPLTEGVEWHVGDARDEALLTTAMAGCEALIHLAAIPAPTLGTPVEVFTTNTGATFTALEVAGRAGVRAVAIASSISLLGLPYAPTPISPLYAPVDEQHPNIGSDPYALSKEVDEATAAMMHRRFGYQSIALRISGTAPMAFHLDRLPAAEADTSLLSHELWAYLDTRDGARAFILAVERDIPGFHVINVMAPDTNSTTPTAELMARHHPTTPLRRPLVGRESVFDVTKARDLLGWSAEHRLFPESDGGG